MKKCKCNKVVDNKKLDTDSFLFGYIIRTIILGNLIVISLLLIILSIILKPF